MWAYLIFDPSVFESTTYKTISIVKLNLLFWQFLETLSKKIHEVGTFLPLDSKFPAKPNKIKDKIDTKRKI